MTSSISSAVDTPEPAARKPIAMDPLVQSDWRLKLRFARATAGLSQRKVARLMRTKQSAVCELETGLTMPNILTLARYAAAVGYRMNVSFEPLTDEAAK